MTAPFHQHGGGPTRSTWAPKARAAVVTAFPRPADQHPDPGPRPTLLHRPEPRDVVGDSTLDELALELVDGAGTSPPRSGFSDGPLWPAPTGPRHSPRRRFSLAKGSGVATGATGMHSQPATMTVTVPAGATIKQVLLYWEGHYTTGEPDSTIAVGGTTVHGTLIGGPKLFFEHKLAATYRADITSPERRFGRHEHAGRVRPKFSFRNNDAGVLVIYDDGTETVIDLRDGQDLAYFEFAPPQNKAITESRPGVCVPTT